MICKNCGNEVVDGASFCAACGSSVEYENEETVRADSYEQVNVEVEGVDAADVPAEVQDPGKTMGIVSLILGIVSILSSCCSAACCLGYISPTFAIAGIIVGILGKKKSAEVEINNKMALVGMILSIVSFVLYIVAIIIGITTGLVSGFMSSLSSY
ncbi:MAG: zinc-ribbon domain-containing protein [Clostridia bacterium]|nr:zinc-ribbon domain-containing protein [Clostridia bacterium]